MKKLALPFRLHPLTLLLAAMFLMRSATTSSTAVSATEDSSPLAVSSYSRLLHDTYSNTGDKADLMYCYGANHSLRVNFQLPSPPYHYNYNDSSGNAKIHVHSNCFALHIINCRYDAGLSIQMPTIDPFSYLWAGQQRRDRWLPPVLRIYVANSTFISSTNLMGAFVVTTDRGLGAREASQWYSLDLAIIKCTVRATGTFQTSYALHFLNVMLNNSKVFVYNTSVTAENTNGDAHAWYVLISPVGKGSAWSIVGSILTSKGSNAHSLSFSSSPVDETTVLLSNKTVLLSTGVLFFTHYSYAWYFLDSPITGSAFILNNIEILGIGPALSCALSFVSSSILNTSIIAEGCAMNASSSISAATVDTKGESSALRFIRLSINNSSILLNNCFITVVATATLSSSSSSSDGSTTARALLFNFVSTGFGSRIAISNSSISVTSVCNLVRSIANALYFVFSSFYDSLATMSACNVTVEAWGSGTTSSSANYWEFFQSTIVNSTVVASKSIIDVQGVNDSKAWKVLTCGIITTTFVMFGSTVQVIVPESSSSPPVSGMAVFWDFSQTPMINSSIAAHGCTLVTTGKSVTTYFLRLENQFSGLQIFVQSCDVALTGHTFSGLLYGKFAYFSDFSTLYWANSTFRLNNILSKNLTASLGCDGGCATSLAKAIDSPNTPSITLGDDNYWYEVYTTGWVLSSSFYRFSFLSQLFVLGEGNASAGHFFIFPPEICDTVVITASETFEKSVSHTEIETPRSSYSTTTAMSLTRTATRSTASATLTLSVSEAGEQQRTNSHTTVSSWNTNTNINSGTRGISSTSTSSSRTVYYSKVSSSVSAISQSSTSTLLLSNTLASPAPLPPKAPTIVIRRSEETATARGVLSVLGPAVGVTAIASVAGGQLGTLNAMARLANCNKNKTEEDGQGEEEDDDFVPVLVHPLRFSLTKARKGSLLRRGQYAAAAISNPVLIPAFLWVGVKWAVPIIIILIVDTYRVCRLRSKTADKEGGGRGRRRSVMGAYSRKKAEAVRGFLGWPCPAMLFPFVTLAEGTAVSIVESWRSGVNYAVFCGVVGFLALVVFITWWIRGLACFVPRSALSLVEMAHVKSDMDNNTNHNEGCEINSCDNHQKKQKKPATRRGLFVSFAIRGRLILTRFLRVEPTHEWQARLPIPPPMGGGGGTETEKKAAAAEAKRASVPPSPPKRYRQRRTSSILHVSYSGFIEENAGAGAGADADADEEEEEEEMLPRSVSSVGNISVVGPTDVSVREVNSISYDNPHQEQVQEQKQEDENQQRQHHNLLLRYSGLLGDKCWYYAEFVSFICSLIVGVAEGLPSTSGVCGPRAAIAMFAVVVQCVCGCATLVPLERFLQALVAASVVPLSILTVLLAFGGAAGADDGEETMAAAISVLTTAANVLGLAQMALQLGTGAVSLYHNGRRLYLQEMMHAGVANRAFINEEGGTLAINSTLSFSLSDRLLVATVSETVSGSLSSEGSERSAGILPAQVTSVLVSTEYDKGTGTSAHERDETEKEDDTENGKEDPLLRLSSSPLPPRVEESAVAEPNQVARYHRSVHRSKNILHNTPHHYHQDKAYMAGNTTNTYSNNNSEFRGETIGRIRTTSSLRRHRHQGGNLTTGLREDGMPPWLNEFLNDVDEEVLERQTMRDREVKR